MVPLLAALLATMAAAEDWPQWRGARADGTWNGPPVSEIGPLDELEPRWREPIGGGYAGITVVGDRVWTLDRPEKTKKGETPDGQERVLCFDAGSGNLLWQHRYDAHYGDLSYGSGPRANATYVDGKLFTLGTVGMASCLDAETGAVIWQRDLVAEADAKVPMWGFSGSPVVVDGKVLLHVGARPDGSLLALDSQTGKEVWRALPDPAGYGTPVVIDAPSGPQIVLWTPENVWGIDPESGTGLWSIPYKVTYGVSIATPVYHDGVLFVTGYWEGSKAITLGPQPTDATLLWENERELRGLMAPPLVKDGYCYSLDKRFGITCFELRTGKVLWADENRFTPGGRNPQLTMVWLNGGPEVLILNSDGELVLARFTTEGATELGRRSIIGKTWANPAFAGSSVYARSDEEIVAVPLVPTAPEAAEGP